MASKYRALNLGLIDEGRFVARVEEALLRAQSELLLHVKDHGPERTKGAKAKVKMEVAFAFDGAADDDYSVKGTIRLDLPADPPVVCKGLPDVTENGIPALFVRASGATNEDPRQGRLTTRDGRVVDPESGEAKPAKTGTAKV